MRWLPALLAVVFCACPSTSGRDAGVSCEGCVREGVCVEPAFSTTSSSACGLRGVACAVCTAPERCAAGVCRVMNDDAGAEVDAGSDAGAAADAGLSSDAGLDAGVRPTLPAVPLHTQGRWILDATNQRVKLAGVNWYGAESLDFAPAGLHRAHRADIARRVRELGFNVVRLPFSLELVETNPVVPMRALSRNEDLQGKRALEVLDAVIEALAAEGLMVVLDNHLSRAGFCCAETDGEGLWYTPDYPETSWINDWTTLVNRYRQQRAVIGVDLRNEPRPVIPTLAPGCVGCTTCPCAGSCVCTFPSWDGPASTNWGEAAARAAQAILAINRDLLIIVQGLNYSTDFAGVFSAPVTLSVANRLVYAPHDYSWYHAEDTVQELVTNLDNAWGYLATPGQPYTAPVWVAEFGTCHNEARCVRNTLGQGFWFDGLKTYLLQTDFDWGYWALNGTQATAPSRTFDEEESFGVLNAAWNGTALPSLTQALQDLQPATQHP